MFSHWQSLYLHFTYLNTNIIHINVMHINNYGYIIFLPTLTLTYNFAPVYLNIQL